MGRINGALLNSIFFGGVVTEGGITAVAQTINGVAKIVPKNIDAAIERGLSSE